jgi:hypothetical protein
MEGLRPSIYATGADPHLQPSKFPVLLLLTKHVIGEKCQRKKTAFVKSDDKCGWSEKRCKAS